MSIEKKVTFDDVEKTVIAIVKTGEKYSKNKIRKMLKTDDYRGVSRFLSIWRESQRKLGNELQKMQPSLVKNIKKDTVVVNENNKKEINKKKHLHNKKELILKSKKTIVKHKFIRKSNGNEFSFELFEKQDKNIKLLFLIIMAQKKERNYFLESQQLILDEQSILTKEIADEITLAKLNQKNKVNDLLKTIKNLEYESIQAKNKFYKTNIF